MDYQVTQQNVAALQIAAVRDQASFANLGHKIGVQVDTVLNSLGATKHPVGRCVVVYWDGPEEGTLLATAAGVAIDVGWEVDTPFADPSSGVTTIQTPAGSVATTTHIGPYGALPDAHKAIRAWCAQNGLGRVGPNWEVYAHPRDDQPTRTDVYYLVR